MVKGKGKENGLSKEVGGGNVYIKETQKEEFTELVTKLKIAFA